MLKKEPELNPAHEKIQLPIQDNLSVMINKVFKLCIKNDGNQSQYISKGGTMQWDFER
jgi:hypothetical protein